MQLSYYTKQRIIKRLIDVIMVSFLIITLFPIFWMVFCSFKDNTDILSGKIFLSRADNSCISIAADKDFLYACSADGGIYKIDKVSNKIKKHISVRSMATSYVIDNDSIWVITGDRGLIQVRKSDLKRLKQVNYPMKDLNVSKVASSVGLKYGGKLLMTLEHKDFEHVFEFDPVTQKFTRDIEITGGLSPFQVLCMKEYGNRLMIGGNKGVLILDLAKEKVVSEFPIQVKGTSAKVSDINIDRGRVYLATSSGALQFDPATGRIIKVFSSSTGLLTNQVSRIIFHKGKMILGTNQGISVVNTATGKVVNSEKLFMLISNGKKSQEVLTTGNVMSVYAAGSELILGTTNGRISYFDINIGQPVHWLELPVGHVLVRWRNYVDMWYNINFGLYLKNSLIICGITMLISMIFATTAAYAFSRFRFPGSNLASNLILATQMIPAIMYLIPLYIMFVKITMLTGIPLKGTYFGLILIYSAFFIPFSIWILRGFFAAIPVELEEAARIDGCSPIQVFWYIVLPLAVPGIIATGVYVFLTAWDELMFAWVLTNADTLTIPVGIRLFVGNYQNRFDLMMAAATVATIPVVVLFFMLQKYIVKGLTAGAVKG